MIDLAKTPFLETESQVLPSGDWSTYGESFVLQKWFLWVEYIEKNILLPKWWHLLLFLPKYTDIRIWKAGLQMFNAEKSVIPV